MGGGRRASDHLPPDMAQLVVEDDASSSSSSSGRCFPENPSTVTSSSDAPPNLRQDFPPPGESQEERRRRRAYLDLLLSYEMSASRFGSIQDAKNAILRYKPGDWVEGVGGTATSDYDVPETTTLLLVGPRGSGKSSLINRILKVFQDDPFAPDRAQISNNLSVTKGSCFLREYVILKNSKSFCVYDSRSLSPILSDNYKLLEDWMVHGVSNGMMVIRDSDSALTRKTIKAMTRQGSFYPFRRRIVNFVIFVVDGLSVLKSVDSKDTAYDDMLAETFNYPFLSFKDDKPAVVVTHGDELSLSDRARVRIYLGELLGIKPDSQIFDIPDTSDAVADLAILDMLRYSLEHADKNFPFRPSYLLVGTLPWPAHRLQLWPADISQLSVEFLVIILCAILLVQEVPKFLTR